MPGTTAASFGHRADVLRRGASARSVRGPRRLARPGTGRSVDGCRRRPPRAAPPPPSRPAQTSTIVQIAPGTPAPGRIDRRTDDCAAGYHSNSWRQRSDTARGLSFASGVRAAASGLDPALAGHADGLRAKGHEFVYGFVLLRAPLDEKLEKKLAAWASRSSGPTTITRRPGCPSIARGDRRAAGGRVGRGQRAASRSSAPS